MTEKIIFTLTIVIIFILAGLFLFLRRPKKLKNNFYVARWRQLQANCQSKDNWPLALKEADLLLGSALKKRRYKGKTVGARLMAAQRDIKDNDGVWSAHKLTKKIVASLNTQESFKLTKPDVIKALESYKAALTDIGALRRAKDK